MDKDVINRKLESLRRCIARIMSKLPITRDELRSNYDLQDIIALNLERAVQTCVDIAAHVISQTEASPPSTMAEGFARLAELQIIPFPLAESLQKAVAFRNILVHNYTDINWDIVTDIVTQRLTDFVQFARAIDRLNNGIPCTN
ncbi:MAG TPA: DUF86 domain-containing protein [Candidatus Tectomicrobia bacterium]|jgi:uncharacterized protein YutE (UPF0331/DUF86 family)